jgi:hypothetical protein
MLQKANNGMNGAHRPHCTVNKLSLLLIEFYVTLAGVVSSHKTAMCINIEGRNITRFVHSLPVRQNSYVSNNLNCTYFKNILILKSQNYFALKEFRLILSPTKCNCRNR